MSRTPGDDAAFERLGLELADAAERVTSAWIASIVTQRLPGPLDSATGRTLTEAGSVAAAEVGRELRLLATFDVDDQTTTPLSILRRATRHAAAVLEGAGVPPPVRGGDAEAGIPGDVYGLAPANFADVDESLVEPGIAWGAAKAHTHLRRHGRDRADG